MENHVLYVDGVPAGFAELDRRIEGEIELVQFGMVPEFIGQGLGKYFLNWTIDKAWSYSPGDSGCTPARWTTPLLCRIT